MKKYEGYLFAKLAGGHGVKSEGPAYFLQQNDYSELSVRKMAEPWKPDPVLHQFITREVMVTGEMQGKSSTWKS